MKTHTDYSERDRVFNQGCADYLRYLGIDVEDGVGINCPYRPTADSGSFITDGPLFCDHSRGDGGNVWKLALNMKGGDKRRALESLHEAAGVPFIQNAAVEKRMTERDTANQALKKAYDAFKIDSATTPANVIEYLNGRKVGDRARRFFGFIPSGKLSSVLTEEEINLTGLRTRGNLIILWYLVGGNPVYYCTRDLTTKAFKKASVENGVLQHPIWGQDSLYNDPHVVWGEGMFDCSSLLEMGFGVAGEITCNIINDHKPELLKALWWRAKHHPDWTFTICLDNDEPTKEGRRPGNAAAEKLALWLWSNGLDFRWVKHDAADKKVDINLLHQNGLESSVKTMIAGAKFVSEILAYDENLCLKNFSRMIAQLDYRGAARVLSLMQKQNGDATLKGLIDKTHKIPWHWQDVYTDAIKDVFLFGSDIYTIFDKERFGADQKHYEVFKSNDLTRNLRKFQKNPAQIVSLSDLDLEYRRPTWRVSKSGKISADEYNLFAPSPLLLQEPRTGAALPEMWSKVLDNLAGAEEKAWLLNHMATYVQTLEKPRTIPVLVGRQGTGKTVMFKLFGEAVGGFMAVDNALIESEFNAYLMNAVVLLDELANSQRDSNQLKNRLKQLINENQSINCKHRNVISVALNNFIVIASNEQSSHVPLVIEDGDRRYSVISGGADKDLAHEAWFDYEKFEEQLPDFMLHLLSRPIDKKAASIPLMTAKKQQIADASQDYKSGCVRAYLEEIQANAVRPQTFKLAELCSQLNEEYNPQFRYIPRSLKPIVSGLGFTVTEQDHQLVVIVNPLEATEDAKEGDDAGGGSGTGVSTEISPVTPVEAPLDADWQAHVVSDLRKSDYDDLFGA